MDKNILWKAVEMNDARFDGAFVYGVRSTGVYCKPSCSSRLPKPENVEFFPTAAEAEAGGFRECKKCRARLLRPAADIRAVIGVCEAIERDEGATLGALAARFGIGETRLRKAFVEMIGVTPKKYAEAARISLFKSGVRSGRDIAGAMYEAGFGSSSRLYEGAAGKLGMTPGAYAKRGRGERIEYAVADCELGRVLAARTTKGICAIAFGDDPDVLESELRGEFGAAEIVENPAALAETLAVVARYLSGELSSLGLPLDLRATAFRMRVWDALRRIPYGKTVSYADVAALIGDPKSVRAVASACASNRVAIAVPCHRVVRSDGGISGYRWGVERKRRILEIEAAVGNAPERPETGEL